MVSGIGLFFGLAGITTLMNQRLAVGFTFGNLLLGLFGFAFGCLMVRMACEMRVVRKLNAPQHIRNTSATDDLTSMGCFPLKYERQATHTAFQRFVHCNRCSAAGLRVSSQPLT